MVVAASSICLIIGGYADERLTRRTGHDFRRQQLAVRAGTPQLSDGGLLGVHALRLETWSWETVRTPVQGDVDHVIDCTVLEPSL